MKNQRFSRNMFGDLPTQKMAQKALPILITCAQKGDKILARKITLHHHSTGRCAGFSLDSHYSLRITTARRLGMWGNSWDYRYCSCWPQRTNKLGGNTGNPTRLVGRIQSLPYPTRF